MRLLNFIILAIALCVALAGCSSPNDPAEEHLRRAQEYVAKNRIVDARAEVDEAIRWHPAQESIYIQALSIYDPQKYPQEAIRLALKLENRVDSATLNRKLTAADRTGLYDMLGGVYWKARDLASAERALQKSLSASPRDPMAMNNLGYFYADEDIHLNRALHLTRRAAKLAPKDPMILDSLGWTYYRLGNYKAAISRLKKAVEFAPDEPDLRYHLGGCTSTGGASNRRPH